MSLPAKQEATQLSVEKARAILAESRDLGECKRIKDQASALSTYIRMQKAGFEAEQDAREIALRAERRIGELTGAMEKVKPGGAGGGSLESSARELSKGSQLAEAGLTKKQAHRAEKLAEMSEEDFEGAIERTRAAGERITKAALEKPHVAHNSGENEWYTPPEILAAARKVMGGIDLDPASSHVANKAVRAKVYFTAEENGLEHRWLGRVWMNPPYAQPLISQFCEKLLHEAPKQAIVLVNNGTETKWGQGLLERCDAVCFPSGRIRFVDVDGNPGGAPLQGQMICYFGPKVESFRVRFADFGVVR